MRIKYLLAAAALAIVSLSIFWKSHWLEAAQEPVLFKPSTRVALADLTEVFKEHQGFNKQVELMRIDVQEAEKQLKVRKEAIEQAAEAAQKEPAGSVQRTIADEKIRLDQQTLQTDVNVQKAKFMEREAQIYLKTYESVLAIIEAYAAEQKIDLVVRFNSGPIDDRQNLQNVMQQLNRQVVFHQKGLDITDEIVRRANAK